MIPAPVSGLTFWVAVRVCALVLTLGAPAAFASVGAADQPESGGPPITTSANYGYDSPLAATTHLTNTRTVAPVGSPNARVGPRSSTAPNLQSRAAKGPRSSFEALSRSAADDLNDEGLSVAGRALQKHGGRPGGSLPTPTGNPTAISQQAQQIVEGVLQHPNRTRTMFFNKRLGEDVVDIRIPGGVGVRYTREQGRFVGFLEPRR